MNRSCQTELASTAHSPVFSEVTDTETAFYRAVAENQSKILQCGDSVVQSLALNSNCSGEVQSSSSLHGFAKLVPIESRARLAWKQQIYFAHICGFYFSEFQIDFQILEKFGFGLWHDFDFFF